MPKPKKPVTDEHVLWVARGPDGAHANDDETLAACRRLEAKGLVYEGPYKNMGDNPVFFAKERGQYEPDDPNRPVFPGMQDYQPMPKR